MGLFETQIRQRKTSDEQAYRTAYAKMAALVSDELYQKLGAGEDVDAVSEILRWFHVHAQPVPANMKNFNDMLEYLTRPAGIMRRSCRLTPGWYKDARNPMLGFRKESGKAVAFLPRMMGGYDYYDPGRGKRIKITKANENLFSEEGIVFYPPLPMRPMNLRDLLKFIIASHTTGDRILFFAALIAVTAVQIILPKISKLMMGNVVSLGRYDILLYVSLFLVCISVSSVLFTNLRSLALNRINSRVGESFEAAMVMRILSLPGRFFRDNDPGSLNSRMYNVKPLCTNINNIIYSSLFVTLFSFVYVFQLIEYAPAAALPAVIILVLQAIVYVFGSIVTTGINERQLQLAAKENSVAYSCVEGVRKIKLAGAEKRMFAVWADPFVKWTKSLYNIPWFVTLIPVFINLLSLSGTMMIYAASFSSGVSVSDYYAFNTAYGLVCGAVTSLSTLTLTFSRVVPLYRLLSPIFKEEPEISKARKMITDISGGFEVDNVSFRYDEHMPYVLDHLKLTVRPGEYVAIVGKTGCGKSTLMRLLLGFETPESGTVRYDGMDLESIDLHSLRRCIGVVLQDGKLFQGDIYSNIVISAPWLSEEEAWKAADLAGLGDDIRAMPMGMHTMITANGGGVSGGQRQRIMIARAIAARPKLLMFDEATSALDNITQRIVSDSLASLSCTRIVIAHRLSTIRQCDRIIMLSNGKIIEDGTYEELLAANGEFADMVRRQQINYNPDE